MELLEGLLEGVAEPLVEMFAWIWSDKQSRGEEILLLIIELLAVL